MDPEACLLACETSIMDADEDCAADCLENYADWRSRGGFEPTVSARYTLDRLPKPGDKFAEMMRTYFLLTFGHFPGDVS